MEHKAIIADACIVCALESEGRTAIEAIETQASCKFESNRFRFLDFSRHYYFTTITDNDKKSLVVTISWPESDGGSPMQDLVNAMISTFHPRIIIMTGICAGKRGSVSLGDIIIPDKTFLADSGKEIIVNDEQRQLQDGNICSLSNELLGWVRHFNKWKEPINELRYRLPHLSEGQNDNRPEVKRHISPMATFMAVRRDDPFHRDDPFYSWRSVARKTESLEMEGFFFFKTANNHKGVNYLIAKGVADFADDQKDDIFHHFASTASAVYALLFIKEYVNDFDMPRSTNHPQLPFYYFEDDHLYFMQSNRSYGKIPFCLSSIDSATSSKISHLIKDWKIIHMESEKLYYSIRKLPQFLLRLKYKINDDESKRTQQNSAIETLKQFQKQLVEFDSKISTIDPSIQSLACINEIKSLKKCIMPLTKEINNANSIGIIEDSFAIADHICLLTFELLSIADKYIARDFGIQ